MLAKRIIACLDVDSFPEGAAVVKGVRYKSLRKMGLPWELAKRYCEDGADELVLLDVSASKCGRDTMEKAVSRTAAECFVPLTVGGGIRTIEDAARMFRAGADKISLNTAAVMRPSLVSEISKRYGRQACVVAIDAKKRASDGKVWFECSIRGGSVMTGRDALEWAAEVERLGAGEILWTSMDADGTCGGYDLEALSALSRRVGIPIIASGGAGKREDFLAALMAGADAVLAAGVFHRGELSIAEVKRHLKDNGMEVR